MSRNGIDKMMGAVPLIGQPVINLTSPPLDADLEDACRLTQGQCGTIAVQIQILRTLYEIRERSERTESRLNALITEFKGLEAGLADESMEADEELAVG